MPKFLVRLLCCFIPSKKIRHRIWNYFEMKKINPNFIVYGLNNNIVAIDKDGRETPITSDLPGIRFYVNGNNNTIKIHLPLTAKNTFIRCENDNVYIEMGPLESGDFKLGIECFAGNGQKCIIGKNTTIGNANIVLNENAACIIGEDCMLSGMIRLWPTDGHSVIDAETGEILNETTKPLIIENHVWVGEGVRLTKRAHIHKNSIISGGSVAYKDYKESGVVIAGNPGKIVKRNITWNRMNVYDLKRKIKKQKKDK